jgi:protein-S-isoprenylcysteine O-methyltransferase Ste14
MTEVELQRQWLARGAATPLVSLLSVKHRMQSLERRAQSRNALEYVGGVAGTGVFAWAIFHFSDSLVTAGVLLMLAGGLFSMWKWHEHTKVGAADEASGVVDGLTAYRKELERQRNARRNNWRWYIAPVLPGAVLFFVALVRLQATPSWIGNGIAIAVAIAWIFGVNALNERAATALQKEIDALDSLGADS